MKYTYLSGREVMPDGNRSTKLTCFECGKPQSHSYYTECGKHICFTCKWKDENDDLNGKNKEDDRDSLVVGYLQY
ncbi:MAG: hypothetical protein A2Y34_04460 [Spirochaetes bacterium GWC1_27_15]|nr:MAG: hypothetical protein A2Y34_04460 [Spirochaetes bacterium GWC1_27_15]